MGGGGGGGAKARRQICSEREIFQERLRFIQRPRIGRPREQGIEVTRDIFVAVGERDDCLRVEQCGRGGAIGEAEFRAADEWHLGQAFFNMIVGLRRIDPRASSTPNGSPLPSGRKFSATTRCIG